MSVGKVSAVLGNVDLTSVICGFLTSADCFNLMGTSRFLRDSIQHNSIIWREQYAMKWGRRLDGITSTGTRPDWLKAFEQLQRMSNAALSGKWFEYDGCFAQTHSTYKFRLVLHCMEALGFEPNSEVKTTVPEAVLSADIGLRHQEMLFKINYRQEAYNMFYPLIPRGPILNCEYQFAPYPESIDEALRVMGVDGSRDPKYLCALPRFGTAAFTEETDRPFEAAILKERNYPYFIPSIFQKELLQIKEHHLQSPLSPTHGDDGLIPVVGVIIWTAESTVHGNMAAFKTDTAQEIVEGYFVKDSRKLFLAGVGRNVLSLDAFLGIDIYKLQVSEDGHSFVGKLFLKCH